MRYALLGLGTERAEAVLLCNHRFCTDTLELISYTWQYIEKKRKQKKKNERGESRIFS